ncbi:MAG: citramalate synthase [Candidatus Omnitrophica bacterium]|nr:citramalate synthase [Candidatus Omnitrophota bacterium]
MLPKTLFLYDTTLRDGAQTEGISFSLEDKIRIARVLDELGVHFIEAGWPSNTKDRKVFEILKKNPLSFSQLVAFGSTHRVNKTVLTDENIKRLLQAQTKVITIFGKSWDLHVKDVLKVSLDENLRIIEASIKYLVSNKREVFFDAEHFFDAYKSNRDYALKTLEVAAASGAKLLVLCDTNGGTVTSQLREIIKEVSSKINAPLGIHTHNDLGLAVANSIVAIENGCSQAQGTINGLGERCGNADLCSVIAIAKLKLRINCISEAQLKKLTEVSRYICEVANIIQPNNLPFVGHSAFAHKGGVHIDAMTKNPKTYEHIDPEAVGNSRKILVSELAGKTPLVIKAKELEFDLEKKSPEAEKLLKLLQDLEHKGYQFEAADGSFALLLQKAFKRHSKFFELESFRVIIEKKQSGKLVSEATIKLKVNKAIEHTTAEGDGPINALDNALRKSLKGFYPTLSKMRLSDFKVRVLDAKSGTAAKVRVLIQSQDEEASWGTVGVSENIIEASWQALMDSVEYKLSKDAKSNQ